MSSTLACQSRRGFAAGLLTAALYPTLRSCGAVAQDAEPPNPDLDQAMAIIGRGLGKPTPAAVLRAQEILARAPLGPCHPFIVAKWFVTLGVDDISEASAGPKFPANPVIIEFFKQATTLKLRENAGDETWWCAAFVNWCLMRARQERTGSALSSSFRQWHNIPEPPRPGDIVVFGDIADPSHGHVGFFVDFDVDNKIMTLGGNQREAGRQMICVQPYPRISKTMRLLSFHRDPAWGSAQ